jgi:hypothetical protein
MTLAGMVKKVLEKSAVQTTAGAKPQGEVNMDKQEQKSLTISAPNFKRATFELIGSAPLVIHRMSEKYRNDQRAKISTGKPAGSKKTREPQDPKAICEAARYVSKEGWDGIHAGAFRNALISACRLVGFKMTLAKLSLFVEQDGWDAKEPQIPLVRIYGKHILQEDVVRMADGTPNLSFRPAYHEWKIKLNIRWDADQFTLADVANLLSRVGLQVGIGEGRPDSKNSAGMGWGLFNYMDK